MLQAEADHRQHAIVGQVIADLKGGPLAHLRLAGQRNGAWLVELTFDLTRAADALGSLCHARAGTAGTAPARNKQQGAAMNDDA